MLIVRQPLDHVCLNDLLSCFFFFFSVQSECGVVVMNMSEYFPFLASEMSLPQCLLHSWSFRLRFVIFHTLVKVITVTF